MEMRHNQNMQMLFDEEEEERLIMMQQQQQQQQHHMGGGEQQDAGKNSYRVSRRIRRGKFWGYRMARGSATRKVVQSRPLVRSAFCP